MTLSLMTPCRVKAESPGSLLLEIADEGEPGTALRVRYDGGKLTVGLEVIKVEDGRLRSVWPEEMTRILLKADKPPVKDTWTVRIEPVRP